MPASVEFQDLVQWGLIGLLDAVEKFELDKNVKFKTYAITRIRGAIYDELRNLDWVPRSVRQKARDIEDAIRITEEKKPPHLVSMTQAISNEKKNLFKVSCTTVLSLNDVWGGDGDDKISLMDSLEAPVSMNPDAVVEKEEVRKIVASAIQELPEKERTVLVLYYYEDLTQKEIGKVLEVTESRVCQLHTKAILRLRSKLTHPKQGII